MNQFFWGTEELAAHRDGTLYYYYEPAEGSGGSAVDIVTSYSPAELAKLQDAMKRYDVCSLESKRKGIPDEGKPTLAVRLGEMDCAVRLWDGEWRDNPRAAAVGVALEPLLTRVK